FFVWHGYVQNYPLVPASDALKLALEYMGITLLLVPIFYLIFKSWQKALVFAFFLMCVQFFFGAIQDLLKNLFGNSLFSKYSLLLPLALVASAAVFFVLLKTNKGFKRITKYLSFTLAILIIVDLAALTFKLISRSKETTTDITGCSNCQKPNIYLVIADEY